MSALRTSAALAMLLLAPWSLDAQAHRERASTLTSSSSAAAPWFELGRALYEGARHRESIAAFERSIQLGECDPGTGAWQVARAYARLGNRKQALRWRQHALDFGFDDLQAIEDDADFRGVLNDAPKAAAAKPQGVSLAASDQRMKWQVYPPGFLRR